MVGGGREQARTMLPSQELLDDLCSRFVLNTPEEDRQSFHRLLFLVEEAHWFYEDNTMEQDKSLKSLTFREFTSLILFFLTREVFYSCAALRPHIDRMDDIHKEFTSYKTRVPVTGAVILDETLERCLLVKGWKPGASWMFPRGKKSKDEEDHICATREVLEETGFDISEALESHMFSEKSMAQQRIRLYIIPYINENTSFAPRTKKEISEIAWHRVDELPAAIEQQSHHRGPNGMKYFMVWPFVEDINKWIELLRENALPQDPDAPRKGVTVWKVKHNPGANGPVNGVITGNSTSGQMVPRLPQAPQLPQPLQQPQPHQLPQQPQPPRQRGTSQQLASRQEAFRSPSLVNFKFDKGDILRRLAA